METRASLLAKLVRCDVPLNETLLMLSAYPWDSTESLRVLQPRDVLAVLERYLTGDLEPKQVQRWAEALETRDDIAYPRGQAATLQRTIFTLANPETGGPLTPELAETLRQALTGEAG